MNSTPTDKEISYINVWREELGFSLEIILEACDRTVILTDHGRLRYCDGILRKWTDKKVATKNDIARLDMEYTNAHKKKITPLDQNSNNSTRNEYTQMEKHSGSENYAELERLLLDN